MENQTRNHFGHIISMLVRSFVVRAAFVCLLASTVGAQFSQIGATTDEDAGGIVTLTIQNRGNSPLTAYAYESEFHPKSAEGVSQDALIAEHVLRDAALDTPQLFKPILPNKSQDFRIAGWNGKVTLKAALWADGTSWGDRVWINKLLQRRLLARRNADITLAALRVAEGSGRPIAEVAAAVGSLAEQFNQDSTDMDVGPEAGLPFAKAKHLLSGPRPARNGTEPLSDTQILDLTIKLPARVNEFETLRGGI